MKIAITSHFDAAHHLPNHKGKCKQVHGHRWHVLVVFQGEIDPSTGMVTDFQELKAILAKTIGFFDHEDLNQVMINPTAELIAVWIRMHLDSKFEFGSVTVKSVRVSETPDCWVEV